MAKDARKVTSIDTMPLMSPEARALTALAVSAVKGETPAPPDAEVNVERLYLLAKQNYIQGIVYASVRRLGELFPQEVAQKWRNEATKQAGYTLIQAKHREDIKALFEENGVSFIGLKGYVLNAYYPKDAVRACADIDLCIPSHERKRVRRLLIDSGYTEVERGANHDTYQKNGVHFEIHHELYSENPTYHKYFKSIFERSIPCPGKNYERLMNGIDFLVFQTTHGLRHFTGGGTGLRTVLDQYVSVRNIEFDRQALIAELEKLGCDKFFFLMESIEQKLFEGGELTEDESFVLTYMVNGGVFGTSVNNASMTHSEYYERRGGTFRYILGRAFLPYYGMKIRYPVLRKCPVLLPFCHLHRWIDALINYRGGIKEEISASNAVTEKDIEEKIRLKKIAGYDSSRIKARRHNDH